MRPYFAIIKDSFRAAMASRVLYVLLILITLLLMVIAPLHKQDTLDWELRERLSVRSPARLLRLIVNKHESSEPIGRIWQLIPESMQNEMSAIIDRPDDGTADSEIPGMPANMMDSETYQQLVSTLNTIIENPDFYRGDDWKGVQLPSEASDLIASGVDSLTPIRSKRLNRILIATAVSPEVEMGNDSAIDFYYAFWEIPLGPVSMTHQQFAQALTSSLPGYFDKFVMSIGLLIAVLVTANMIPETFQSGSLNLLLSKPISRWGLYVAKFAGGCVFVLLCTCYLFVGVWFWLGLAMNVWDRSILLSIPLYVIVFAIYFSVSAFVGLIWRSAIVSVILTLMFWAFCFFIGSAFGFFNTKMNNSIMVGLLPVGEQVFAIDSLHQFNRWDDSDQTWDPKLEAELGQQGKMIVGINSYMMPMSIHPATSGLRDYLAPIHDRENSRVITSRYEMGQSLASGKKRMFVSDASDLNFKDVGYFPLDTIKLFSTPRGIVAASSAGSFYRLNPAELEAALSDLGTQEFSDPKSESDSKSATDGAKSGEADAKDPPASKNMDLEQDKKPDRKLFDRIGPDAAVSFRSAGLIDYSRAQDEFAAYRLGVVSIFRADGDKYSLHESLKLKLGFNKSMSCRLAYQGGVIVLAFGNGKVITVDGESLVELEEYQLESRSGIRRVAGSQDGRYFGVLYRNGNLWMLDQLDEDQQFSLASVQGQGGVCSFAFGEQGDWWVTQDSDRVTNYQLSDGTAGERYVQSGTWVARIYRFGLRPFYTVCPKPSEFYKLVPYLSSAGDSESNENVDVNLTAETSNPWSPLTSGLAFMLVMLALGCVVFHFKDY